MPMRLPFRRRTNSSPNQQSRPPPGPKPIRKSGNLQRTSSASVSYSYLSSSPHSSSYEFNDAKQRWLELAKDRRSGLSLASSDDFDNAAASIDSINISDQSSHNQFLTGVRHGCTPPNFIDYHSNNAHLLAPSAATSESLASNSSGVPSASPSPTSHPRYSSKSSSLNQNQQQQQQQQQNHHQQRYFNNTPSSSLQHQQQQSNVHNNNNNDMNVNVGVTTPSSSPSPTVSGRQSIGDFSPNPSAFRVDYTELTALKQKFNQLDAEGKGFLSRTQFYELFQSLMDLSEHDPHHTPMFNFAYSLFHSAGDTLNLREFVTGMSILSKGSEEERLKYLFMMYDKDNSGTLNAPELKQVFRVMGSYAASQDFHASDSLESQSLSSLRTLDPAVLDDLIRKTVRQYDLDGDGNIGFDDFVKWCQSDPVVKTWLDMLCYDTARGVARLRGESEKDLIARELQGLGIGGNEFWQDSLSLTRTSNSNSNQSNHNYQQQQHHQNHHHLQHHHHHGNPHTPHSAPPPMGLNPSSSNSILPPTVSSASQPNVSFSMPERSDSSGEYDNHGINQNMRRRRHNSALSSNALLNNSGHGGHRPPSNDSMDGISTDGNISSNDLDKRSTSTQRQEMTKDEAIGSFDIDFKTLIFEKQIGSGSFAVVWKCKWLDSPVAVKVFKSGPRLMLNGDGTPAVTPPVSHVTAASSDSNRMMEQNSSGGCDVHHNNNNKNSNSNQRDGFVEHDESFEPEFDSMMSARNNAVSRSIYEEEMGTELSKNQARFLQEVSLLKSIRHPNLLLYMGACVDVSYPLCIVSELIDGGSLFELLHGRDQVQLSIRQKLLLTQDIARGMLYLHGRDPIVLHRDLKSANILVEQQNDDSFKGTIIDFGLSKFSSTQASIVPGRGRGLTGSLVTMAPEVMNEQKYEPRSDVYSYAIVCWEIWCGRVPFGKITAPAQLLMKVAIQGVRPEFEAADGVPIAIQKLIRACWDQDVRKRPDFLMIVKALNEIRHDLKVDVDS